MKNISFDKVRTLRRVRNQDLLRKMKKGESLTSFNSLDSWYPPRPVIEKDRDAVKKLYGEMDTRLLSAAGKLKKDAEKGPSFPLRLA
ncbi:MAG: hypothetical protein AB7T49_12245 [Oligoflexales bacterium]